MGRQIDRGPHRVGRYDLIEILSDGPSGTVYRGNDPLLARDVAIFLFSKDSDRHLGERLLALFSAHPNIVDIHDAGVHDGRPYHLLEYVDGRDVDDATALMVRIATETPPPIQLHRRDLPAAIEGLIGDMLALDPGERPSAAHAAHILAPA